MGLEFWVQGSRVQDSGLRIKDARFRVCILCFRITGVGFGVNDLPGRKEYGTSRHCAESEMVKNLREEPQPHVIWKCQISGLRVRVYGLWFRI